MNEVMFKLGDIVLAKDHTTGKKRLGEIVFIAEGKRAKFKLIELNPKNLSPKFTRNLTTLKYFSASVDRCKRLNNDTLRVPKVFELGDVIRQERSDSIRFGIIVGFHHPDGLQSDSWEKGYNGKDIIECVEISRRSGLPRKRNLTGKINKFEIGPSHAKLCEILPMDQNGGVRIKNFNG